MNPSVIQPWGLLVRRVSLALLAAAAFVSLAAAADLPARAPVYTKAPAALVAADPWTGFYIGGNVGGAWGRFTTDSPIANSGAGTTYIATVITDINAQRARSFSPSAFTGGVQAGYNAQFGNVVVGVETDINSFRLTGNSVVVAAFTGFPGPGALPTYTDSVSTSWLFTGRGRVGLASNNTLFYVTGGVAVTNLSYTHTFAEGTFAGSAGGTETSTASATKTGWTVGGGLEYAWARNWSVKGEYLYLDFGSVTSTAPVIFPGPVVGGSVFTHTAKLTASVARLGINYKF